MRRLLLIITLAVGCGIIYAISTPSTNECEVGDELESSESERGDDSLTAQDRNLLIPFESVLDTLSLTDDNGYYKENDFFFYDITGDGHPELWISSGACEADKMLMCYTIDNDTVRKILHTGGDHANYIEFEGKLRRISCSTGDGSVYTYEYKQGTVREKCHGFFSYRTADGPKTRSKEARRILIYFDEMPEIKLREIPNKRNTETGE